MINIRRTKINDTPDSLKEAQDAFNHNYYFTITTNETLTNNNYEKYLIDYDILQINGVSYIYHSNTYYRIDYNELVKLQQRPKEVLL